MDNKDQNLGDFFRKKLEEFDQGGDSWSRPDEEVRTELLGKIKVPAVAPFAWWKVLVIGAAAAGVALTAIYIWKLKNENRELRTEVALQNRELEKAKREIAEVQQNFNAEKDKLVQEKLQLEVARQDSENDNQELTQTIRTQEGQALQLKKELQEHQVELTAIKRSIWDKSLPGSAIIAGSVKENDKENQPKQKSANRQSMNPSGTANESQSLSGKIQASPQNQFSVSSFSLLPAKPFATLKTPLPGFPLEVNLQPLIQPAKRATRFELGYEFSFVGRKTAFDRSFKDVDWPGKAEPNIKSDYTPTHGISAAFSPARNWWIRSGIRKSAATITQELITELAYNRRNEYQRPDQDRGNDIELTTTSPYFEARSVLSIVIPQGRNIEEDEVLDLTINETMDLDYLQVPLGIDHYLGNGRLSTLLQAGIQWNQVTLSDYQVTAFFKARDRALRLDRSRAVPHVVKSTNFFAAYAGIGLDFELAKQWHLRAAFNYTHDFIDHKTIRFSNSTKSGTAFRLGVNRRF